MPYLLQLVIRLAEGAARLPSQQRARWIAATQHFQMPCGGFRGRSSEPDLYYTAFAVRTLSLLDGWSDSTASAVHHYLTSQLDQQLGMIDLMSLVFAAYTLEAATGHHVFAQADSGWVDRLLAEWERHRGDDGGYGRTMRGAASSTYQTFLILLGYQLLDRPIPRPEEIVQFLRSQRADGGGFLEIRAAKRAGANPTAAAIGALEILDALDDRTRSETVSFLLELADDEGGFRANTRIPLADLLSTFTAAWTLDRLGAASEVDWERLERYVRSLEVTHGFLGATLDREPDVEYTFYGVAALALRALLAG